MSQKQVILTELDAILDTRLGTISRINEDAAVVALNDMRYYTREVDDFEAICGITKAEFDEAYAKRDEETLVRSIITGIPLFLDTWIRKLEREANVTPNVKGVELRVNLWPYKLDKETVEAIMTAIMAHVGLETMVNAEYIPPEDLTPAHCRMNYTGMVMYNWRQWMEIQAEAFQTVQCPRMVVTAPRIYRESVPDPKDVIVEDMPYVAPFAMIETLFSEMMAVEFIPVQIFSIYRT